MNGVDSNVRADALDYLGGLSLDPSQLPPRSSWSPVALPFRRLEEIHAIGVDEGSRPQGDLSKAFPTEALLAGLSGETIRFAFQVEGGPGGVRVSVGTWGEGSKAELDQQHRVLTSLVDGLYPSVTRVTREVPALVDPQFTAGGIARGIPTGLVSDGDAPWDRLLRSLQGARFAVVILAEPIDPRSVIQLRDTALEDLRAALSGNELRGAPPLTRAYERQLEALVDSLNRGLVSGAWRTGVYLLGDASSYGRLAAAWQGLFSDPGQALASLRVLATPAAAELASGWVLPYQAAPKGPRVWRHPFLNQSLLDTPQLAAIAHLPRREAPGFGVRPAPAFAVSGPALPQDARRLEIGAIYSQQRLTGTSYRVDLDQLTRHAFIAGLTGAGKTNTVMHLLTSAADADVPFLVIEPAKTEYRAMLGHAGLAERLRVFTLGREQIAPLRLNPFEVPEGTDVATHVDLLKAVFMGAFALWIPLPQILERCLIELYTERGWDFTTGGHRGGPDGLAPSVPTLTEVVAAVERTVPTLGFKPETTQEFTASLTTRLNGLRRGGRGLMLDVENSLPISELLRAPTVIELEGIGDDADKAFIMGLLLVRLYEHRRAENSVRLAQAAKAGRPAPASNELTLVVVVEEAHRLLSGNKKHTDNWNADPQGAFSDAFSQMLSEVRAYGQGIIISDQVPVRLAPDVLKNTNLKIAHRLVAGDDRAAMAEAMSMNDEQSRLLATLPRGRAAVFSEGDFTPVIVGIPKAKDLGVGLAVDDAYVGRTMSRWRLGAGIAQYFKGSQLCAGACRSTAECREARTHAESPEGQLLATRLFNTMLADADGMDLVWPDVVAYAAKRTGFGSSLKSGTHSLAAHLLHSVVTRRATQGKWPAAGVVELVAALRDAVAERVGAPDGTWMGVTPARRRAIEMAQVLMRRTHDPYTMCGKLCPGGLCRFRDAAADLVLHPKHAANFEDLDRNASLSAKQADEFRMSLAKYFALDLVPDNFASVPNGREALKQARWQAVGCVALAAFCNDRRPTDGAERVQSLLVDSGWREVAVVTGLSS